MNRLRTVLLLLAGAGAFYAAADWTRQRGANARAAVDGVVAAVPKPPARAGRVVASTAAVAAADAPALAASRRIPSSAGDAFAPLSWLPPAPPAPPPAPVAAAAPPPAPVAPPLPFVFVGMVEKGADRPQAYLAKGEVLLVVAAGDTIDNHTYRVDALTPSGVLLTYLPLGQQQTVNIPGGSP
jgi:hypothetical protein